ncbi:MAG TPA: LLM class F420-dependent oxidoreductase [Dehalococcoidia bacterium]
MAEPLHSADERRAMTPAKSHIGFGFGVFPFTRFRDVGELVEVVERGDELGYEALMLPEHMLPPRWPDAELSTKFWYDLPTLAAYLAARTSRIKFLTSVLVVPYHQPVALAKALATLDVLSGGRVLCGVGAGWMKAEFRRLNIPFEERGAITDEYLLAMKELWTSDAPSFHGKYVSFEDVSFFPRPVQKPHIPILIGGTGPRPFQRAAAIGDGWIPMTATFEDLQHGIADIKARMTRIGRDPDALWVGFTGFSIGSDPEVRRMREHVDDGIERPSVQDAEHAIAEIERYRAAGVTFLSVGLPWQNAADLMRGLEWFARKVMPAFQ